MLVHASSLLRYLIYVYLMPVSEADGKILMFFFLQILG